MSTIFVALYSARTPTSELLDALEPLVPIAYTERDEASSLDGSLTLRAWTVAPALARGGRFFKDSRAGVTTCFHGWIEEDGALSMTVGEVLSERFARMRFPEAIRALDGNWSAVHLRPEGKLFAATDRMCAEQLYFGERDGIIAISNRATLVAAALNQGQLPRPNAGEFAWWLSANMCQLVPEQTIWPRVRSLDPREYLLLSSGNLRQVARPEVEPHATWEEAFDAFSRRCAYFERLPGIDAQLALTGGKDSRAVLGGLLARDALGEQFSRVFIMTTPGNPDALVAERLARHYDLPFENDGVEEALEGHLFDRMRAHMWRTEGFLHSWDIKARWPDPTRVTLNGHFGEVYRSHFDQGTARVWPIATRRFLRDGFVDQHALLTPHARAMVHGKIRQWIEREREGGIKPRELRDVWHRQCRMWRWASFIQRGDALGGMVINPLPSGALLAGYRHMPLRDQLLERTHFELIERADDWLWRQPFANATWSKKLAPRMKQLPTAPLTGETWPMHSRQHEDWRRHGADAADFLRETSREDGFHDVFEPAGVERLLARYEERPDGFVLKALFGLVGARIAIREGIVPFRLP